MIAVAAFAAGGVASALLWRYLFNKDFGPINAFLDWIGLVLALPLLILWPFWLLAKVFGAKWTIIVDRGGAEVHRELVRGWSASEARMAELAHEIQRGARSGYFRI